MDQGILIALVAVAATLAVAGTSLVRRRRRQRRDAEILREKVEKQQHLARSLHPVIDPDVCIGSLSCLKACPEGDILGVIDHAARLVHADHCIGHGRCAAECPVNAIRLVFGSAERGIDLPEVDQFFESSRPGVHVVGELGGMGLIRNAMTQGLQAAERLVEVTPPGGTVVVVGTGPAGLATALGLKAGGVAYRLLEKGAIGGTVANYPRQKLTMTEPVDLPLYGRFGKTHITKEELLATMQKVIAKAGLRVELGTEVTGLTGSDGAFTVQTGAGPIAAAKVVLAVGRRGSPRRLGVPGEEQENVTYQLTDPEQYDGTRVLVVGGGDSAIEAAVQLATESSAKVAISYRNAEFAKCREANRTRIGQLIAAKKIEALLPSQVTAIGRTSVRLDLAGRAVERPNDFVIVCIGGELPIDFLAKAGVGMRRFHGEAPGTTTAAGARRHGMATSAEQRQRRRLVALRVVYATLGVAVLAYLAWKGWDYYWLPRRDPLGGPDRAHSPLHLALRSAGSWGHGVGIVATAFMLSNFVYALRKRTRAMTGLGPIKGWLDFHVFVGFMSPLVIAFHAAFQVNNQLASATYLSLAVVVTTGIIGRYIYGLVPAHGDRAEEFEDLAANFERLRAFAAPALAKAGSSALLDAATAPVTSSALLALFVRFPFEALWLRVRLAGLRRRLADPGTFPDLRAAILKLSRLRWQLRFYTSLKRLLRGWRVFHATLAVFLVLALVAHIGVSLYLGYGLK